MNNRNLVRGLFLMAIGLTLALYSFNYQIGHFSRSGPGLFPLLVSCIVFVIGMLQVFRSFVLAPVPIDFNFKNIGLVILSLVGFALLSEYINMTLGIIFMVFCVSVAGTSYWSARNVKVCVGLIAAAFGFKYLLGLQLPLL